MPIKWPNHQNPRRSWACHRWATLINDHLYRARQTSPPLLTEGPWTSAHFVTVNGYFISARLFQLFVCQGRKKVTHELPVHLCPPPLPSNLPAFKKRKMNEQNGASAPREAFLKWSGLLICSPLFNARHALLLMAEKPIWAWLMQPCRQQ